MTASYQINVRNSFLAFNFQLAGNQGSLIEDNGNGFTVKTLKKESANILDTGMECTVLCDGRPLHHGTVSTIEPKDDYLYLKCKESA